MPKHIFLTQKSCHFNLRYLSYISWSYICRLDYPDAEKAAIFSEVQTYQYNSTKLYIDNRLKSWYRSE